jgi:hypothetical protein
VAAVAFATPAAAHEGNPAVRVELDAASVPEGLEVEVVASVTDQLVVSNPSGDVLEILDDNGDPFLRIGPEGVDANLNAVGWYQTNNPFGTSDIPDRAVAGAAPDWAKVAAEPSWGWFDHRLHPADVRIPPEIAEAGQPAELARWQVPVRWRGAEQALAGAIVYRPIRGSVVAELVAPPAVDGLTIGVLQGRVPGLFLENDSGEVVVVRGADGEPFLRFGRRGVQANRHSPAWLAARRAEGGDLSAQVIDASLRPAWQRVSDVPRFGWIDPRTAYPDEEPPAAVIDAGVRTALREWEIPLAVGGQEIVVRGVTSWEPLPGAPHVADSGVGRLLRPGAVAAGVLGLVALLWLLRRRPRTPVAT